MWDYIIGLSQNIVANIIWAAPAIIGLNRKLNKHHRKVVEHHERVEKHLGIKEVNNGHRTRY